MDKAALSRIARIALGTVQFGLPYGISNSGGQVTPEEAHSILALAREHGIGTLDTAVLYGESEATLGRLGVQGWNIITKLPSVPEECADVSSWVRDQVSHSLARLRLDRVDGLLLHRPAQLLGAQGDALYGALLRERASGRVRRIGISVYGPDELDLLPPTTRFDIVQAPMNVLDARMVRSGWAARLREAGCEFHARSIFLQGLLLMPSAARPAGFARWARLFDLWDTWLHESGLSPLQACLAHALHAPTVDRLVLGVESAAQLAQIVTAARAVSAAPALPAALRTDDPALLNPALWNKP